MRNSSYNKLALSKLSSKSAFSQVEKPRRSKTPNLRTQLPYQVEEVSKRKYPMNPEKKQPEPDYQSLILEEIPRQMNPS
jgi:hypothetical protein